MLSVTGLAVAIVLLTTGSGIALGLGSQTAVQSDDVDYWVVPESGDVTGTDSADQILVSTTAPEVKVKLQEMYPKTVVVTQTGLATEEASTSSLPLAMAVAAFVTALVALVVAALVTVRSRIERECTEMT